MECKLIIGALKAVIFDELIETLWNVNTKDINLDSIYNKELIETLWNVNRN